MKTRTQTCCRRPAFATEADALHCLDRLASCGMFQVLPTDVHLCCDGWHLEFPASADPVEVGGCPTGAGHPCGICLSCIESQCADLA